MVDGQHESEPAPDVDEAMIDASGDMAKTPPEEDPPPEPVYPSTADAEVGDDASDTVKSPDAEDSGR